MKIQIYCFSEPNIITFEIYIPRNKGGVGGNSNIFLEPVPPISTNMKKLILGF